MPSTAFLEIAIFSSRRLGEREWRGILPCSGTANFSGCSAGAEWELSDGFLTTGAWSQRSL
jgi:hypothetical protein